MEVNVNLKIARVVNGMSQYDLASQTGIPQSRLSLIERGFFRPTQRQSEKIAEAVRSEPEKLFPELFQGERE